MKIVTEQLNTDRPVAAPALDVRRIREDFPILNREINGRRLAYLDSAASSQKPQQVIRALVDYYERNHANVHRGMYTLAAEATELFEASRDKLARFINAPSTRSVIFTRNATEAINLVAYSWGETNLTAGDEILISRMEHHANLVPWVRLAKKTGATLKTIPLDEQGRLDLSDIDTLLNERTRILALTRMSNVLGTIVDVRPLCDRARAVG
ncbi:MAG TPA: aminotransferase class V-fold PLP-dependent enzyme, partial [candidate division Zixibacteria bacterium]|nr:aminotransferase class V-fold PLP-dependent enzyme [candidate division Zixibacteria bacterium]